MLVVVEPDTDDVSGAGPERGAAEIVILVFNLGRPVLREHVFEAGADGVAVAMITVRRESLRHAAAGYAEIVPIVPGITALGVEQCRAPGIAKPTGDRSKLVAIGGDESAEREEHAGIVAAQPAVLGFDTQDPAGGELIIKTALHAAEEAGIAARQAIVARESAADVTADVEAGPVVDRRGVSRRSFGVGAGRKIGCECWHGRAESDEGHSTE